MKKRNQSGQIALILVLIIAVIGATAVSVASQATVDTKVQEVNVDSSQAMLAAEAGLEDSLKNSPTGNTSGTLSTGVTYNVTDTTIGTDYAIVDEIVPGETYEVNLVGVTGAPTALNVFVKAVTTSGSRRLIIQEYKSGQIVDSVYDNNIPPASGFTTPSNPAGLTLGGKTFDYSVSVPITAGNTTAVRLTVFGGNASIGYKLNSGTMPNQIRQKSSIGTVKSGSQEVRYGINYLRSVTSSNPSVFDYVLFSGSGISQ